MLQPLYDKVVVALDPPRTEVGGIIVTEDNRRYKTGKIIACGPVGYDGSGDAYKSELAVGDHVVIAEFGGYELEIEGEPRLLCRTDEIMARIS